MDSQSVLDYGRELFGHYSTEEEPRERFLFAKALQNNDKFHDDVKREFLAKVEEICGAENHQEQKRAFRKLLLENIKNMVMWQEFFKREGTDESQMIFSVLRDSFESMSFEEFEKQMAYFQLYSEALYYLTQRVLNRFYDEVFENNYSTMLTRIWRTYFEHYFKFIVAKSQGREFLGRDSLAQLNTILEKVEASALKGEDLAYNMDKL